MSVLIKQCINTTLFDLKSVSSKSVVLANYKFYSVTTETSDLQAKPNQKLIKVAIIGVPNAGKSTFINNLINHRVCPTSNKVHTTRRSHKAIYTEGNNQIILFDTPGLVTEREIKKHHLESTFSSAYRHSIQQANCIGVIHDVSSSYTRHELHPTVLNTLQMYEKLPSFLVLNKIDVLKSKRILLDLVCSLTNNKLSAKRKTKGRQPEIKETESGKTSGKIVGWSDFSDVFMVSSITGDGLQDVMQHILRIAKPGNWEYTPNTYTDLTPEETVVESVRARLLDYLPQEIPYSLKTQLEYYSVEKNVVYVSVQVACPSARIERLICGVSNGKMRQITERVTSDLVSTFGKPVSLTITTIVNKSIAMHA